jgi:prepilin-type processing-associated H-X9-DG protein
LYNEETLRVTIEAIVEEGNPCSGLTNVMGIGNSIFGIANVGFGFELGNMVFVDGHLAFGNMI